MALIEESEGRERIANSPLEEELQRHADWCKREISLLRSSNPPRHISGEPQMVTSTTLG